MEHQAQVELLTDELRVLVGRGANPMRVVTLPVLRELAHVDGSLTVRQKGSLIRHFIKDAVESMPGAYYVQDQLITDDKLRRALKLLLKLEGTGQDATSRRERVLNVLGLNYPLSQFRRPDSPERELLRILADYMVSNFAT